MHKSFEDVMAKGCFKGEVVEGKRGKVKAHVVACVNLGQSRKSTSREYEYYCVADFPSDCSVRGCPKYGTW